MRVGGWGMGVGIVGVGSMKRAGGRCILTGVEEGMSGWVGRRLGWRIDWLLDGLCRMGFGGCSRLVGWELKIGTVVRTCRAMLDAAVRTMVLQMYWSLADGFERNCNLERSYFLHLGRTARSGHREQRSLRTDVRSADCHCKVVRPEVAAGAGCRMTHVAD